ncbi:MAG: sulfotransferase, partial [Alphaproteobacteria bacterium]|nr:sulfotransferase [Alphaproteobacteria bacterium]
QIKSQLIHFMRCGTTLLQHILNAHPDLYASEEVHAFAMVEEQIQKTQGPYPQSLANLNADQVRHYRQIYYDIHKRQREWAEGKILVDKYPMLANMTGLVHRLFPNAKFLFICRHPCDVVLSCYMQLFVPNPATVHCYHLEDAVKLYVEFMELWTQYERVLDLSVHYVCYENITENFEAEIRPVLEFIGVPWDDAVTRYNEKVLEANVISPSYEQVSETIYKRAAYRWEKYKEHLEPYMEQLEPYIEKFGYKIT